MKPSNESTLHLCVCVCAVLAYTSVDETWIEHEKHCKMHKVQLQRESAMRFILDFVCQEHFLRGLFQYTFFGFRRQHSRIAAMPVQWRRRRRRRCYVFSQQIKWDIFFWFREKSKIAKVNSVDDEKKRKRKTNWNETKVVINVICLAVTSTLWLLPSMSARITISAYGSAFHTLCSRWFWM